MRRLMRGVLVGLCALAEVLLAGAIAGSSYGTDERMPPPSGPQVIMVTMAEMSYDPQTVAALPGDIVTWINYGLYAHTVTPDPVGLVTSGPSSDLRFPNGVLPGLSFSWSVPVDAAHGTKWFYHCRFYGQPGDGKSLGLGMAGSVVVK